MKTGTLNQSRVILIGIFLVALATQLILAGTDNKLGNEEFNKWLRLLLSVYSVHFGVMLGAIFSKNETGSTKVSGFPFTLAICLAAGWNLLLVSYSWAFALSREKFSDFIETFTILSQDTSFLVAGALVYFFGRPAKKAREE